GARDQHRFAVLARQVEQGAEAAQAAHHLGAEGPLHQRLDAFDDFIAGVDVDACITVGQRGRAGHDGSPARGNGDFSSPGTFFMDAKRPLRHHSGLNMLPGTKMPKALLITLLLALLLPGWAHAQRMEGDRAGASGMYQAEVAVGSQTESARQSGFSRALAQVLGKMSGDAGVANRPGVARELRRAGDYVVSYYYRQDEGRSAA